MNLSARRVRGIFRKDLRELRRNRSLIAGMAIIPVIFSIQPLISVFALAPSASTSLEHEHGDRLRVVPARFVGDEASMSFGALSAKCPGTAPFCWCLSS